MSLSGVTIGFLLAVVLVLGLPKAYEYVALSPPSVSDRLQDVSVDTEVAVLQAELEELRSANAKIIGITTASLGIVGVIAALLVGYNIYQFRSVDPKLRAADNKEARDTLSATFSALIEKQSQALTDRLDVYRQDDEVRWAKLEQRNEAWQTAQSAELSRRMDLHKLVSEQNQELTESSIDTRFSTFERQFQAFEYDRVSDQIYRFGPPSPWMCLRLLEAALPLRTPRRSYRSKYYPEAPATFPENFPDSRVLRALRLLEQSLQSGDAVSDDLIMRIRKVIDDMPPIYAAYADRIRDRLQTVETTSQY